MSASAKRSTRLPQCAVALLGGLTLTLATGCSENYRVGEYVLVSWCDAEYPAYVTARRGATRFRVHFEGYEPRWDTEVGLDDIKGRLEEPPKPAPPLCERVARAMGLGKPTEDQSSAFAVGARVNVSWRGSLYKATIIEVVGPEHFKVHYDGHESSWDEVISSDRIAGPAK